MGKSATGKVKPEQVLLEWVERDLTAEAEAGRLEPAFEVDELVDRVVDVIGAGRHPIVAGDSGVGKSAVIHELVRRTLDGRGPAALEGKRVLQLSIRNRASALLKPEQIRPEMQKLIAALLPLSDHVVPFFRDIDLAFALDLEPHLTLLGMRFHGPILAEGDGSGVETLLETTPDLDRQFLMLKVPEPDMPTMERIVARWAEHREQSYEPRALGTALELSHRFLSRSHFPRKALDFLSQVGSVVGEQRAISELDVIDRFHTAFKIPRLLIDPRVPFDPVATERDYSKKVLEQPEAVAAVVRMISLIKSGLSDARRPFGAFLFVGPTGVGKTHIAQHLAAHLFGSRDRLIRINMADYPNEDDALTLFGRPGAYVARQRRGELTMRLLGHPFAVLLLDELEKAHSAMHDRFLQLIDEGTFINGAGETVSCRSSIVIATSNAGAEVYRGPAIGFSPSGDLGTQDSELDRRLLGHFRLEFLNRFDQIVHFHPLTRSGIRSIALREIEALQQRAGIASRGLQVSVDEAVLDWLAAHGYDPQYGARFLRRAIERHVSTALADVIVGENPSEGDTLELSVRAGRIRAKLARVTPESEPAPVRLPQGPSEKVKSLDRGALVSEGRRLLERAQPRLAALQRRREEARELLAVMNDAGFWDDPAEARRVLDVYREHDVAIQIETRLAGAVERLAERLEDERATTRALGAALEQAARAVRDWDRRAAEQGPSAVWLVLRNADPLAPAPEFLEQLVQMELSWCRRLGLVAELVAFGSTEGVLARAVVEVEGPGAVSYLSMEHGTHRLHNSDGRDSRVTVELIGKSAGAQEAAVSSTRHSETALGVSAGFVGRIERGEPASTVELFGVERATLGRLLADLRDAAPPSDAAVVRGYLQHGAGARDPRTKATIPRFRDVIAGRLDALLEAYQAQADG